MSEYSKLGYGNYGNIDNALSTGVLDERDIVITKDTSEFIYIRDDKTKQVIRSRIQTFDSEDVAITSLNKATDTYAGQPVAIKDSNGKYMLYTVQNGESGYIVEKVATVSSSGTGFVWTEF